ncbi:MAG: hypothetical protein N7Q72_05825, partial [Spiroplasma sp. Tabriz.8]|nr:hypothetical protein [Spiroplasma sp. Tabriz.8]
ILRAFTLVRQIENTGQELKTISYLLPTTYDKVFIYLFIYLFIILHVGRGIEPLSTLKSMLRTVNFV